MAELSREEQIEKYGFALPPRAATTLTPEEKAANARKARAPAPKKVVPGKPRTAMDVTEDALSGKTSQDALKRRLGDEY